ncbi:hypothetical protein [Leclercia adecarboxylata]|uniref:hypothetical protein n=1 Tax=Leclercia adecarboxylata TaxID=83655 RepID=UPI00254F30E1|nr:hypothetical protein [Leclercia adecarboxylata]
MYKTPKVLLLSLILFSAAGCSISQAVNKTLSPPADTKWVNVEVKNPSRYTKPFPLEVRYISYECMKKRISGADGSVITEPSYNVIGIPMQQEIGDIWKAKVAMNGGGSCKWTLSAINLGIEYTDASHLGKDLVPGTAVGVTLAFDNDASRNGQFDILSGSNPVFSSKYYPLIKTNKMIRKNDSLSIFGEEDFLQKRLINSNSSINVKFMPDLDESKVVKMVAPTEHKVGAFYKIIYPDGTVVSDGSTHPDIRKMGK